MIKNKEKIIYHITASWPCDGCQKCSYICKQSAIGELPGNSNDYWPMIDINLCNGCGECAEICPAKYIIPVSELGKKQR